jgi:hypothetical protein
MDIHRIFQGIADKMLIDFNEIQAQIVHDGERGEQREQVIRDFLTKYLPKKYAIGTGHVLDPDGNISRQCDIVIYDAFNCPLLLVEEGYQLFPIEAVLGVIEVKSVINASLIAESAKNIQSVKQLQRYEPVIGGVFAYTSTYSTEPKIEMIANTLRRVNNSIPPKERIDLFCVLTDGVLRDCEADSGDRGLEIILESAPTILFLFLHFLLESLEKRQSSPPFIAGYASGNALGVFKQASSSERESLPD